MPKEVIIKKLEQLLLLIKDLEPLLAKNKEEFKRDIVAIRVAERNFQLIVETASDINTAILIKETRKTPDTYKQSFTDLAKIDVISQETADDLSVSAKLRNILTHEYEFEEDYGQFYDSAKMLLPGYQAYAGNIKQYLNR